MPTPSTKNRALRVDLAMLGVCTSGLAVAGLAMLLSYSYSRSIMLVVFALYVFYRLLTLLARRFRGESRARLVIFGFMVAALTLGMLGMGRQFFVFLLLMALDYMTIQQLITPKKRA